MSYEIEIIDEYSFGEWFSHDLRFATEAEATEYSESFPCALLGILDLRIVRSDNPVNARWINNSVTDEDGKPFDTPKPPPTPKEVREEAKRLTAAWNAIVDALDAFPQKARAKQ